MTAEPSAPGASLLYRSGEERNFELPEKPEVVIGSAPTADVAVRFPGVSRRHARILFDGRNFWVEDAGSANRTFLNGRRLVRRERLDHLDVLTLGRSTDLIFVRKRVDPARRVRRGIVRAWLERLDGLEGGTRVEIPLGSVTIGRAPINNIQAEGRGISKVHARLDRSRSLLVLTDLHSVNGTFLGRERVETCALKDGDVFSLAGARRLRVRLEEGDVETAEDERSVTESAPAAPLPTDWKTRIEWSPEERAAFDEEREKGRKPPPASGAPTQPTPPAADTPSPAAAARRAEAPKPPSPSAPASGGAKPVEKAPDREASPARPAAEAKPAEPAPKPVAPTESPAAEAKKPAEPAAKPAALPAPPAAGAKPAEPAPRAAAASAPPPRPAGRPAFPPSVPAQASPSANPPSPPPALEHSVSTRPAEPLPRVFLDRAGSTIALTVGDHDVGRVPSATIVLDTPAISRRHAVFHVGKDRVVLEDLLSRNGTLVGRERITAPRELKDGDVVAFGDLEFRVRFPRSG